MDNSILPNYTCPSSLSALTRKAGLCYNSTGDGRLEDLDVNPARAHSSAVGSWRHHCHKQGLDFTELLREQHNPKLPVGKVHIQGRKSKSWYCVDAAKKKATERLPQKYLFALFSSEIHLRCHWQRSEDGLHAKHVHLSCWVVLHHRFLVLLFSCPYPSVVLCEG